MEDNFPISNIPLLFTQYRTRILEESGQEWFHSENNLESEPEIDLSLDSFTEDNNSSNPVPSDTTRHPELTQNQASTDSSAKPINHSSDHYKHPDPWEPSAKHLEEATNPDSAPLVTDQTSAEPVDDAEATALERHSTSEIAAVADVVLPTMDAAHPNSQVPSTEDSSIETDSPSPAQTVNLFPFENGTLQDSDTASLYDLTEFDNGELEVPPVAIRESQIASFETVQAPKASQEGNELEEDLLIDPNSQEIIDPKTLSSAELAKYRLRNCL